MTTCRFALYDPAQPSPGGSYWAWIAQGLDVARLNRLYYEAAVRNRPPDPNRLPPEKIWGGIVDMGDDLVGIYRYFDGGRDARGRPGRFVILVALLAQDEVLGRDLSPIFLCETARRVALRAPEECPLAIPTSLEEEVELPITTSNGTAMFLPGDPSWHRKIRPGASPGEPPWIHDEERVAPREATIRSAGIEGEEGAAPTRSESDQADSSPQFCVSLDEIRVTLLGFARSVIGRIIFACMILLLLYDIWSFFPSSPIVPIPDQPSVTTNIPVTTPKTPRSLRFLDTRGVRPKRLLSKPNPSTPLTRHLDTRAEGDVLVEGDSSSDWSSGRTGKVYSNIPVESEDSGLWWTMITVLLMIFAAVVFPIIFALVRFLLIQRGRGRS